MGLNNKQDEMGLDPNFTYLNHASIGPLPRRTFLTIEDGFKLQMNEGERKIDYPAIEELWESLRLHGSTLVGGEKEGIAITPNTASGLHIVAEGLSNKFSSKSNIVIPDLEFVTNSYTWQEVAKKHGVKLEILDSTNGVVTLDTWEKAINDDTVLISLSHVQGRNGFTTDLISLSDIAHSHGALVVIDAIQSLGAVPFNVKQFDVDFVAAAAYKWMLGPLGKGLFYCKPELVDQLQSVLVGWFSTPNFRELYHQKFVPWSDARRFQQSMIDPTLNGFDESLKILLKWNVQSTYKHILDLQDYLIDKLIEVDGFDVASSLKPKERSGIMKINHKSAEKIVRYLETKNITVAYRDTGIRVSPHGYNTREDIDILMDQIMLWIKTN